LIALATERAQRNGKRLLIVIDQFEEALIISSEEHKTKLATLLRDLAERALRGLTIVLSLRVDYLNDLPLLGLPNPAFGPRENAFEVRPFTRVAAQAFVEGSGLKLGPKLLAEVMEEAAEIEDMPDRVRPIVLNMLGLVVGAFSGVLPRGIEVGHLLSGYVERSVRASPAPKIAIKILRTLTTAVGTKRASTTDSIAKDARTDLPVARGCLVSLVNAGLVRRLPGAPERWEVAHDFVARLWQPILRSWRSTISEQALRILPPLAVVVWLIAMASGALFYPSLHDEYLLTQIRSVGLVPGNPDMRGATFTHNGMYFSDDAKFWGALSLLKDLSYRTVGLQLADIPIGGKRRRRRNRRSIAPVQHGPQETGTTVAFKVYLDLARVG
jgi:hypothetical protein